MEQIHLRGLDKIANKLRRLLQKIRKDEIKI